MFFYFLQFCYVIGRCVAPAASFTQYLLDMVKQDVYSFQGGCRQSGNCCRGIMLYDAGKPISTPSDWNHYLSTHPEYFSFKPQKNDEQITAYDCESLTCDNQCSRYQSRPQMCKNYPVSFFFQHGYIHSDCGYSVVKNMHRFKRLLPSIKQDLANFSSV